MIPADVFSSYLKRQFESCFSNSETSKGYHRSILSDSAKIDWDPNWKNVCGVFDRVVCVDRYRVKSVVISWMTRRESKGSFETSRWWRLGRQTDARWVPYKPYKPRNHASGVYTLTLRSVRFTGSTCAIFDRENIIGRAYPTVDRPEEREERFELFSTFKSHVESDEQPF